MSFAVGYKYFCACSCAISCILNGILIYIARTRTDRVGFYRYFTYAFVLVDVLYSLSIATVQPFWYAGPGMLGFFSIAPWNDYTMLITIAYQFWFVAFFLVIMCNCNGFIYRYGLLCSPRIVSMFEDPKRLAVTFLIILTYITFWMFNSNYLIIGESQTVRQILQDKFSAEYNVDLLNSYAFIVDINDESLATKSTIGCVICIVLMQSQILTMVFCGWSIHKTILSRTMSGKLKKIHGRALNMMISQALNPLLFLYSPSFINLFGMFSKADFGDLPKALAMMLALFPIINPIIVIYFTDDNKKYLLNNGQPSSTMAVSVVMSKSHDTSRNG